MDYRSPLESIFNVIGTLPQGHDKPVKQAFYTAVAFFLLFLCCAAGYAVYVILEPFIKPLIWAVLVGSALHPLKYSLRHKFQSWIEGLDIGSTPVAFGIILLPLNIIDELSEFVGENLWKRFKLILGFCITIPLLSVFYYYTPRVIVSVVWTSMLYAFKLLSFFLDNSSLYIILFVLIGYISLVFILWKPENNKKFHYASIGIWLLLSCWLAQVFGSWQVPIFLILQVIFFSGFICEVYEIHTTMSQTGCGCDFLKDHFHNAPTKSHLLPSGQPISIIESLSLAFHDKPLDIGLNDDMKRNEDETSVYNEKENISKGNFQPEIKNINKSGGDVSSQKTHQEKNPWSLELFDEEPKPKESDLSNATVVITNQRIHLIQEPKKPTITEILNKPNISKVIPQLQRSISQPHFQNSNLRKATILKLGRKRSFNYSRTSLIDMEMYESTYYLYSIFWLCVIMIFWKNMILLPLLPILILYYAIKHLGIYLGLWSYIHDKGKYTFETVEFWCKERHDALVPVPIRGLYHIVFKVNQLLEMAIKGSMDTVASCVVIMGLIVFLICASIFIAFQVYAEAIMLVQMTSNVINQTVVHNPELRQLLPPTWDNTVDSILDNAYQYGREGISKAVKGITSDVDSEKSQKLERQILELWDRVYQNWMSSNDSHGPKVSEDAVKSSWEEFINDVQKSPELFNFNSLIDFGKQNIGTLMSLLESVWSILKGNISLIIGSFSTFLSVILGGGTAVLNFILNGIVFLTTLFYLLNSSGDLYKPVEILTNLSASGRRFGQALEGAVNGVFTASFKMAAFYGMWTWFIHNLFGVKIVYLPSVFASILGAVPFLGTYWACIPAVLDLWIAQDRSIAAIIFAFFQFLPTSVVDTTIYKEIKGGGHPYLTGLSIAGGIFCLGVEGAIIGPMLLCGLYVAIELSSSLFRESPSEESLNLQLQLQDRS